MTTSAGSLVNISVSTLSRNYAISNGGGIFVQKGEPATLPTGREGYSTIVHLVTSTISSNTAQAVWWRHPLERTTRLYSISICSKILQSIGNRAETGGGDQIYQRSTDFEFSGLCAPGKYLKPIEQKGTDAGVTSGCPGICLNGYYAVDFVKNRRSCVPCPSGSYCPRNDENHEECPVGKYGIETAATNASVCKKCDPGEYQSETGKPFCLPCIPGRYSSSLGTSSCEQCPFGWFQADVGKTVCNKPAEGHIVLGGFVSVAVPPGSYLNTSGEKVECEPGYMCRGGAHNRSACSPGWYANTTGSVICVECAPGKFTNISASPFCIPCPRDTFTAGSKETMCSSCDSTKTTTATGGAIFCTGCPSGWFMDTLKEPAKGCVKCSPGKISRFGSSACASCDAGTYTNPDNSSCISCEAGRHGSNESGANNRDIACHPCPPGRYSSAEGVKNVLGCNLCSPGRYSEMLNAPTVSTCTKCEEGQFQAHEGNTTCEICPLGYVGNVERGSTGCTAVPPGSYLNTSNATLKCDRGYKCEGANWGRVACSPGSYAKDRGSVACIACPPGRATAVWATIECDECGENTIAASSNQTLCAPCPAGRSFSGNAGTTCVSVPPGSYVNANNMTVECEEGFKCEGANRGRVACSPGSYAKDRGSVACIACPPGRATAVWATIECDECGENTIAASSNQTLCAPCPAGRSFSEKAGTNCVAVPPGSYVNANNMTMKCEEGFKCAGEDKGRVACPTGSYASNNGSVDCFPCSPGKYVHQNASTSCTPLPKWVAPGRNEGQPNCSKPDAGSRSPPEGPLPWL